MPAELIARTDLRVGHEDERRLVDIDRVVLHTYGEIRPGENAAAASQTAGIALAGETGLEATEIGHIHIGIVVDIRLGAHN